jgi:hypothetical protein
MSVKEKYTDFVESDECYTPAKFVDLIRDFAKHFTLDPFSCEEANKTVKANHYLSISDNAFEVDWFDYFDYLEDNLWVQPPYSRGKIAPAIDKTLQYAGYADIYLLVNSETSSRWYQKILSHHPTIVFPNQRMKFANPYRADITNTSKKPQTLFYFGNKRQQLMEYCLGNSIGAVRI